MQLSWAEQVHKHTHNKLLLLTPLAVAEQTIEEATKFGIKGVSISRDGAAKHPITVANYENLHKFSASDFGGIVLDEASILKGYDGATRKQITEFVQRIDYRLSCTATPAPNDYMEIGTQAEFLGVMTRTEMLATFFVHDGGETTKWRLKRHAAAKFWEWVASWAVVLTKPSDLGYSDEGFTLPELEIIQHVVPSKTVKRGRLLTIEAKTLQERRDARRRSLPERVALCAELVNKTDTPWIIWCDLNAESEALRTDILGAEEITGSQSQELKTELLTGFKTGKPFRIVTKPSIAGFGMNWQHCSEMAFVGLSDSFEQMYQAIRRCWRYGQKKKVRVHVITSEEEGAVVKNIWRKEAQYQEMIAEMVKHMKKINQANIKGATKEEEKYVTAKADGKRFDMRLGDSVELLKTVPDNSVDYSVFSPPFASLYTYSNSLRDMGNCKTYDEFFAHYDFLCAELYRVLRPGRLLSFHCMLLPTSKQNDGYIGLRDFRGDLIRAHQKAGMIYHSEVVIWKDPVIAMQRTKALGLLHKQIKKDSAMSRQGIPDYLITMRKPGDNPSPVAGEFDRYVGANGTEPTSKKDARGSFSIDVWQRYASPVWMDIDPGDTLQHRSAREQEDERHIAPLQLQVIARAMELWTNEDDLVLSPFAGIGSEGYVALRAKRRFLGFELKKSYYEQAVRNLKKAESLGRPRALLS